MGLRPICIGIQNMITSVNWVRFKEDRSEVSPQSEYSTGFSELNSSQNSKQTGKDDLPRGQRPSSRGILALDELNNQLVDEDNLNLIAREDKNVELVLDSGQSNDERDSFVSQNLSNEKQVFSEAKEDGSSNSPEKSLPTPFDNAPGFYAAKRSSGKIKKTRNEEKLYKEKPQQLIHTVVSSTPEHQELSWTKFEDREEDNSLCGTPDRVLLLESKDRKCETASPEESSLCMANSYASMSDRSSLTSTPVLAKGWVSFQDGAEGKIEKLMKEDGQSAQREFQRQLSSTSSAVFSETVIPDIFEVAVEQLSIASNSYNAGLIDHSPEKSKEKCYDIARKKLMELSRKPGHDDFETDSNFSGEICDLNNLENDSLLRDTRKPFAKEGIFQASSCKKPAKKDPEKTPEEARKRTDQGSVVKKLDSQLDDYPQLICRTEWSLLYRYPDRKKRFASREWITVNVKVEGDAIRVSGRLANTEIVKEIPLHPFFVFTLPVLHTNSGNTKVHSVKLQYVKYKETRKMASKFHLEHTPSYTPVLKLASKDNKAMKEFIETVENVVRQIESHRDKGITHRHEEIFIDCDDICQYEVDGDGKVKRYNITCQIRLRAFITGIPNLYLFLNDINSYNKQKNKRADGKQPKSNRWIQLENAEYHPSVDVAATNTEGGIVFKPPDSCSFELMRFRVRSNRELPMLVKASIDFTTSKAFEIKAECKIGGEGKVMKYRRTNIVFRFPIPTTWTSVFVKSRSFSGQKRYVEAKADNKTYASGVARTSRCFIEVSTGSARYEPEFMSLVWRVGDLPILASGVPADAVQSFSCQVNLPFDIDLPRGNILCAEVEYEIAHAVGSEIQVQEVLLSDGRMPDKWVCYRALYSYNVLMTMVNRERLVVLS